MTASRTGTLAASPALLCLILCLAGCGALPPKSRCDACPFDAGLVKVFTVEESPRWQPSGVVVRAGDEVFIEAEGERGTWWWRTGPDGMYCWAHPLMPHHYVNMFAMPIPRLGKWATHELVGRVGEGRPFVVGSRKKLRIGDGEGGELSFAANTSYTGSGRVRVTVHRRRGE